MDLYPSVTLVIGLLLITFAFVALVIPRRVERAVIRYRNWLGVPNARAVIESAVYRRVTLVAGCLALLWGLLFSVSGILGLIR